VTVRGHQFYADGQPYYFVGANYWYGGLLGLEKDKSRGIDRLRRELDFLKANGVTNLRIMAGAEGSGDAAASGGGSGDVAAGAGDSGAGANVSSVSSAGREG